MRLIDLRNGNSLGIFLIFKFEVKFLPQESCQKFEFTLSQCFAKTDSIASMERNPAIIATFFTIWSQEERIFVIKSLRQEFHGSLPLARVVTSALEVYHEKVILLELVLTKFDILYDVVED